MAHHKAKSLSGQKLAKSASTSATTLGGRKSSSPSTKVRFGSAVISASPPKHVDLQRNVSSGQLAFARVALKLVKPGVSLPESKSVPLYHADPSNPGRLIRQLKGKTAAGLFIGGKFKVMSRA